MFEIQKFAAIESGASTVTVEGSTITYKVEELDATAHVTLPAEFATGDYTDGTEDYTVGSGESATIYTVELVDSTTGEANVTAKTADGTAIPAASLSGAVISGIKVGSSEDVTLSLGSVSTLYKTDISDVSYYTSGSQNVVYQLSGASETQSGSASFDSLGHITINGLSAEEELGASYTIQGSNAENQSASVNTVTTKTGTFTLTNAGMSTTYSIVAGASGAASIYVVEDGVADDTPISTDGKVSATGEGPTYTVSYDDEAGFSVVGSNESTVAVSDASVRAHYAEFTNLNTKVVLADDNSVVSVAAIDSTSSITPALNNGEIVIDGASYTVSLGSEAGAAAATLVATSEPALDTVQATGSETKVSYEATVAGATNDFALVFDEAGSLTGAYFATDTVRSSAVNSGDTIKDGSNVYVASYDVEGGQASLTPAGDSVKYTVSADSTETAITISGAEENLGINGAVVNVSDGALTNVVSGEETINASEDGTVEVNGITYTYADGSLSADKNGALDSAIAATFASSLAADTAHVTLEAALGAGEEAPTYTIRLSGDGSSVESVLDAEGNANDTIANNYTFTYDAESSNVNIVAAGANNTLDPATGTYTAAVASIGAGIATVIGEYTAIVDTSTGKFIGAFNSAETNTNLVTTEGGTDSIKLGDTTYSIVEDEIDGVATYDIWNGVTDTVGSVSIKDSTTAKVDASNLTIANTWASAASSVGKVNLSFTINGVEYTAEGVPYSAEGKFLQEYIYGENAEAYGDLEAAVLEGGNDSATNISKAYRNTDGVSYTIVLGDGSQYIISANATSLAGAVSGADAAISLTGGYALSMSDTSPSGTVLAGESDSIATSDQPAYTEIEYVYNNSVKYVVYAATDSEGHFTEVVSGKEAYANGAGFSGVDNELQTLTADVAVYTLKGSSGWSLITDTTSGLTATPSNDSNVIIKDTATARTGLPAGTDLNVTLTAAADSNGSITGVTAQASELAFAITDKTSSYTPKVFYNINGTNNVTNGSTDWEAAVSGLRNITNVISIDLDGQTTTTNDRISLSWQNLQYNLTGGSLGTNVLKSPNYTNSSGADGWFDLIGRLIGTDTGPNNGNGIVGSNGFAISGSNGKVGSSVAAYSKGSQGSQGTFSNATNGFSLSISNANNLDFEQYNSTDANVTNHSLDNSKSEKTATFSMTVDGITANFDVPLYLGGQLTTASNGSAVYNYNQLISFAGLAGITNSGQNGTYTFASTSGNGYGATNPLTLSNQKVSLGDTKLYEATIGDDTYTFIVNGDNSITGGLKLAKGSSEYAAVDSGAVADASSNVMINEGALSYWDSNTSNVLTYQISNGNLVALPTGDNSTSTLFSATTTSSSTNIAATNTITQVTFESNAGTGNKNVSFAVKVPSVAQPGEYDVFSVAGTQDSTGKFTVTGVYASADATGDNLVGSSATVKITDMTTSDVLTVQVSSFESGTAKELVTVGSGSSAPKYNLTYTPSGAEDSEVAVGIELASSGNVLLNAKAGTIAQAATASGNKIFQVADGLYAQVSSANKLTAVFTDLSDKNASAVDSTQWSAGTASSEVGTINLVDENNNVTEYKLTTSGSGTNLKVNVTSELHSSVGTTEFAAREAADAKYEFVLGDFAVTTDSDGKITAVTKNGEAIETIAEDGSNFTDGTLVYTATFDNGGTADVQSDDTLSLVSTGVEADKNVTGTFVDANDSAPDRWTATVTFGTDKQYNVTVAADNTVLSVTDAEGNDVEGVTFEGNQVIVNGETYDVEYSDNGTASDTSDDTVTTRAAGEGASVSGESTSKYSTKVGNLTVYYTGSGSDTTIVAGEGYTVGEDGKSFTVEGDTSTYSVVVSGSNVQIQQTAAEGGSLPANTSNGVLVETTTINFSLDSSAVVLTAITRAGELASVDVSGTGVTFTLNEGAIDAGVVAVGDKSYNVSYNALENSVSAGETAASSGITGEYVNTYAGGKVTINGVEYTLALGSDGTVEITTEDTDASDTIKGATITTTQAISYTVSDTGTAFSVINGSTQSEVTSATATVESTYFVTINGQTFQIDGQTLLEYDAETGETGEAHALNEAFDIGNSSTTVTAISNSGVTYNSSTDDVTFSVTGTEAGVITLTGSDGQSYTVSDGSVTIGNESYSVTYENGTLAVTGSDGAVTVTNNTFTVDGTYETSTATIEVLDAGEFITYNGHQAEVGSDGTVTLAGGEAYTLSGSDGAYVLTGATSGAVTLNASNEGTVQTAGGAIATLEGGIWNVSASDVTLENATGAAVTLGGAVSGVLGASDTYSDGAIGSNGVFDSYLKVNGDVILEGGTTLNGAADANVEADGNGNFNVKDLPTSASVNGTALGISDPDGKVDAVIGSDGVSSLGAVGDGSSIGAANAGTPIDVAKGATVSLESAEEPYNINGAEIGVANDADGIAVALDSDGSIASVSGVSAGASLTGVSDVPVVTDEAGKFSIDGDEVSISGDDNVTIKGKDIEGLDGTASLAAGAATINGEAVEVSGDSDGFKVAATTADGVTGISGISDGANVSTEEQVPIATDGSGDVTLNGSALSVSGDKDGIVVDGNVITGLDENAMLGGNGNYTVNGEEMTLNPLTSVKGGANGSASKWAAEDQAAEDAIAQVEELTGAAIDPVTQTEALNKLRDALGNDTLTSFEDQTLGGGVTVDEDGNSVSAWNGDMAITLPGVNGDLDADFSQNTGRKVISIPGKGNTDVKFNDEGGNAAIIGQDARGKKNMQAGNGGDLLANFSTKAEVTMTGGTGDDTIVAVGGANEVVDVSNGGADLITATLAGANVKGYDPTTGARFRVKDHSMASLAQKLIAGIYTLGKAMFDITGNKGGSVKLDRSSNALFDITNDSEGTFVRMETASVNAVSGATVVDSKLIGWGSTVGGAVNAAGVDEDVILIGNTTNAKNSSASTLTGGNADDTIYAGAGDVVNMSAGTDAAQILHDDEAATKKAAVIAFGSDSAVAGDMTVENFYTGHATLVGDKSDKVSITDRGNLNFDFVNGNLRLKLGQKSLTLANTTNVSVDDETGEVALYDDNDTNVKQILMDNESGTNVKYTFINEGATATIDNKATGYGEYYGMEHDEGDPTGAAVDYSAYEQALNVNLSDTVTAGQDHYFNIDKVIGGKGETKLSGNDRMNTLVAGAGDTSIYGAEGRDSLVGFTGEESLKTGSTSFFYKEGNDLSTISGFAFGTEETSDKLTTDGDAVTNVSLEGDNVIAFVGDNYDDHVVLQNAKNQVIKVNAYSADFVVEVGDSLSYDGDVTQYYGKGDSANVSVSADAGAATDTIDIFTNNWNPFAETKGYYENIKNVNASAFAGSAKIAGSEGINNVLTASAGNSSLWGGFGAGDDTLIGGSGDDAFYYTRNSGNDVVNNASDGDVINLFDISLDDIDLGRSGVDSNSITIALKDEQGSIKVNSSANVRFNAADASYTADEIRGYFGASSSSSSVSSSSN